MAEEIRFPRLGWSMEEGRFVGWLKSDGDAVREGEPLFEMEGEKAVQEIEALGSGILHIPMETPTPDSVVPVGRLLGYLLAPGEKPPQSQTASPDAGAKAAVTAAEEEPLVPGVASPAVRRLARELGIEVQQVSGTGRSGRITREDIERFAGEGPQSPREVSSEKSRCGTPRAKRLAAQHRIDWESLTGTGRGGRVREEDVRRKVNAGDSSRGVGTSKLYTHRRRAIAERLRLSRERTIPVTLHTIADVTALVRCRARRKEESSRWIPSFTDMIAKEVAQVLRHHRALAVRWNGDHSDLIPIDPEAFGIGLAVDTRDGLLVPVIRNVLKSSLEEITGESQRLIERAREGALVRDEMEGGVITLTNLGGYGIDAFTPIINYPEVAILGIGSIRREPVYTDGERIEPRDRMTLSLTFDHAALDGAPAAAFLRDIVAAIRDPSFG